MDQHLSDEVCPTHCVAAHKSLRWRVKKRCVGVRGCGVFHSNTAGEPDRIHEAGKEWGMAR